MFCWPHCLMLLLIKPDCGQFISGQQCHRLRIHYIDVQLGVFIVLREWLGYVIRHSFLASTHARFYEELGKCQANGNFKKT